MFYCGRGKTRRGNEISRHRGNEKKFNTGMKERTRMKWVELEKGE